jgi:L-threonylcarbamoyladenylate synthase
LKFIKVKSRNLSAAVAEAVAVLRRGGIIAHPTDTVWGLACDAGNPKAIQKLHALKKSDPTKPLLLNLPSKSYLDKIASKLCKAHKLTKEFWPGALSLLVLAKNKSPCSLRSPPPLPSLRPSSFGGLSRKGDYSVATRLLGVRLPDHELSAALARKFGKPLTTTSANLSGKAVAKNGKEVAKIFPKIDLILDDGSVSKNNPSTLVDVSGAEVKLIREGSIPFKEILRKLSSHS